MKYLITETVVDYRDSNELEIHLTSDGRDVTISLSKDDIIQLLFGFIENQ